MVIISTRPNAKLKKFFIRFVLKSIRRNRSEHSYKIFTDCIEKGCLVTIRRDYSIKKNNATLNWPIETI